MVQPTTPTPTKQFLPSEQQQHQELLQNYADRIWQLRKNMDRLQKLMDGRVDRASKGHTTPMTRDFNQMLVEVERRVNLLNNDLQK